MSSIQIEQKSYEMPPRDGFAVTHFTQSVTLTNTGNATLSISAILAAAVTGISGNPMTAQPRWRRGQSARSA